MPFSDDEEWGEDFTAEILPSKYEEVDCEEVEGQTKAANNKKISTSSTSPTSLRP